MTALLVASLTVGKGDRRSSLGDSGFHTPALTLSVRALADNHVVLLALDADDCFCQFVRQTMELVVRVGA